MFGRIALFFEALLPSRLRIAVLRMRGAKIGQGCFIGSFCLLDAKVIRLGDHVRIARFNLIHRLVELQMDDGSRMNGFNWITGASTGKLQVGRNTAITRFHFFEASGDIILGANTIVAGRNSHFFTHGISSTNLDDVRSIEIGPWSYIGSSARFVPGSGVSAGTFVGMGAVVSKRIDDEYVLVAGNPARVVKSLGRCDPYFDRSFLPHDHHPKHYSG